MLNVRNGADDDCNTGGGLVWKQKIREREREIQREKERYE